MKKRNTQQKKRMKEDIKMIFELHDLVKKQTILAFIATLSSATVWYDNYIYLRLFVVSTTCKSICIMIYVGV